MVVTCVHVSVKPEHVEDFIKVTKINHENSIKELENTRFDILQDPQEPTKFILYEAYASEAGAAAHKQTQHYLVWRDTVSPWMAEPRQGMSYTVIAP